MQSGQFIIGMVNGIIEAYQSIGVEKLLPEENLRFLYDLGKYNSEGKFIYQWASSNAISKTVLIQKSDGEGRKGTINHTVIIKFDSLADILDHTDFLKHLDAAFNITFERLSNPLPEVTL